MPKNFGAITDPKDLVTKEYADGVVVANPTLAGTESDLSGIQIGNTKYKIAGEDAATREMIAPIEETSTATAAHGLGQCFVYNGVLYRALTNIAIGDTITPNTNCVQTSIAMNFTRSVQLTSAQYNLLTTAEKNAEILYVITDDNGGGIAPYTSNPVMDGVANPGSADAYSRGDHVHPSDTSKADKSDLASISVTGTTNTTGATISNGTYFYLNGSLVQATADIASGATFTSGTNYSSVTAGGLNSLKSALKSTQTTEWKQVLRGMSASSAIAIDLSQYSKIAVEARQTFSSAHYYGSYMLPVSLISEAENRFTFDVVTSWQMGAAYNAGTRTLYIYSIQDSPDYSPYWRVLAFN